MEDHQQSQKTIEEEQYDFFSGIIKNSFLYENVQNNIHIVKNNEDFFDDLKNNIFHYINDLYTSFQSFMSR